MVLVFIIIRIPAGVFLPDLATDGSLWDFIRIQCIGDHVDIVTVIAMDIVMDIIEDTITVIARVMLEDVTIQEIDTRIDQEPVLLRNQDLQRAQETKVLDLLLATIICIPIEAVTFIKEIKVATGLNRINDQQHAQVLNQVHDQQRVRVQHRVHDQQRVLVPSQVHALLLQVISLIAIIRIEIEERRIIITTNETGLLHLI